MRVLAAVVGGSVWLAAAAAAALSAGEITARARAVGAASSDATRAQQQVAALGELTLAFIELSDSAARSGTEAAQRGALRGAFEAIDGPLDAIYSTRARALEQLTRTIMEEDGDLEALYETADFQQSQAVAAQALYYRNWLRYYGGRVSDGARRKELLTAAEKGFSELAVGDQAPDLLSESVLGRGLCNLELGHTDAALRDFKLVIEDKRVSPERQAKARLAMLDAYLRAGRTADVLRYADEVLKSGGVPARDVNLVRFVRLQTLFDAADKAKGAEAERYRREATAAMDSLRAAGPGWRDKVDALMVAHVDDPAAWAGKADTPKLKWELARLMLARNDYDGATPLLREVVASDDAAVAGVRGEALYWLGVGRFRADEPLAAVADFDAALAASPAAEWAGEARYLRFKAFESLLAHPEADAALLPRYEAALQEFLAEHPSHPMASEARYRLGESRQGGGEFEAAIAAYEMVQGDPALRLRARFGTLQCRFELLKGDGEPSARAARLEAIGADLDAVDALAAEVAKAQAGDVALQELQAKATLLRAVYLSLRGPGGDEAVVALLADFDTRFPQQTALWPQAVRLRLGALAALDRFADAEAAVQQHGAALRAEQRPEALDGLAATFSRAAARRRNEGDAAGSEAAARTALALYALVGDGGGVKQQLAMANLRATTEDWAGAAAIYREVLAADPKSLVALRGLARAEEAQGRRAEALAHWAAYGASARPGDLPWFQAEYQQARLTVAQGDARAACARLTKLRPAMPGLTDLDLKRQLTELYEQACD